MSVSYLQVLWDEGRPVVEEVEQDPRQDGLLLRLQKHIVLDVVLVVDGILTPETILGVPSAIDLEELLPLLEVLLLLLPRTF